MKTTEGHELPVQYRGRGPLYCYIFNEDNCTIGKLKITDYKCHPTNKNSQHIYEFRNPTNGMRTQTKASNLNRYVYHKVFTHENNDSKALGIIFNYYKNEANRIRLELTNFESIMTVLKSKQHDDIFKNYWEE